MKTYHIYVTGKKGIFDPPGETAKRALENLGYEGVGDVKIGKFIELTCSGGEEEVEEMCARLLANPVIEDFRIELADEGARHGDEG